MWERRRPRRLPRRRLACAPGRVDGSDTIGRVVGEHRYLTTGMSERGQLLIVAHTEDDDRIRIISARAVTWVERRVYEEGE
jgi:uncharacterized DUF497 family protein